MPSNASNSMLKEIRAAIRMLLRRRGRIRLAKGYDELPISVQIDLKRAFFHNHENADKGITTVEKTALMRWVLAFALDQMHTVEEQIWDAFSDALAPPLLSRSQPWHGNRALQIAIVARVLIDNQFEASNNDEIASQLGELDAPLKFNLWRTAAVRTISNHIQDDVVVLRRSKPHATRWRWQMALGPHGIDAALAALVHDAIWFERNVANEFLWLPLLRDLNSVEAINVLEQVGFLCQAPLSVAPELCEVRLLDANYLPDTDLTTKVLNHLFDIDAFNVMIDVAESDRRTVVIDHVIEKMLALPLMERDWETEMAAFIEMTQRLLSIAQNKHQTSRLQWLLAQCYFATEANQWAFNALRQVCAPDSVIDAAIRPLAHLMRAKIGRDTCQKGDRHLVHDDYERAVTYTRQNGDQQLRIIVELDHIFYKLSDIERYPLDALKAQLKVLKKEIAGLRDLKSAEFNLLMSYWYDTNAKYWRSREKPKKRIRMARKALAYAQKQGDLVQELKVVNNLAFALIGKHWREARKKLEMYEWQIEIPLAAIRWSIDRSELQAFTYYYEAKEHFVDLDYRREVDTLERYRGRLARVLSRRVQASQSQSVHRARRNLYECLMLNCEWFMAEEQLRLLSLADIPTNLQGSVANIRVVATTFNYDFQQVLPLLGKEYTRAIITRLRISMQDGLSKAALLQIANAFGYTNTSRESLNKDVFKLLKAANLIEGLGTTRDARIALRRIVDYVAQLYDVD